MEETIMHFLGVLFWGDSGGPSATISRLPRLDGIVSGEQDHAALLTANQFTPKFMLCATAY